MFQTINRTWSGLNSEIAHRTSGNLSLHSRYLEIWFRGVVDITWALKHCMGTTGKNKETWRKILS